MSTGQNDTVKKVSSVAKTKHNMEIQVQMVLPKALYDRMRETDPEPKVFNDHVVVNHQLGSAKAKRITPHLKPNEQLGATIPDCMKSKAWDVPKLIPPPIPIKVPREPKVYTKKKVEVPMKGSQGQSRPTRALI